MRRRGGLLVIITLVAGSLSLAQGAGAAGGGCGGSDFDGDGRQDLAVGVPGEDSGAGAVNVLYGSASGITATADQFFRQGAGGLADTAEVVDLFGSSLATGDFNGDGRDDLAVGAPGEDSFAGAVSVIYGSASGLAAAGNQIFRQGTGGVEDTAEGGDQFGFSLAACDFDGDGRDDLAVGVRFEDLASGFDHGAVNVLYGSPSGLTATGDQFWHQDSSGVLDPAEGGEFFGGALRGSPFPFA